MKKISVLPVLIFAALVVLTSGSWAQGPLVTIETVTVGDSGNAPQNTFDGRGAVGYPYQIGKFEVTVEQYASFLNSVATVTTNNYLLNLWNPQMGDKPWYAGVGRSGNGTASDPYIYSVIGNASFPIDNVSWFDAARFCNWLHNGAVNGASTETGAYTLNGATDGVIDKNTNAKWWIPSFNEWWKAAYYKGGSTNAGYWTYPTQSDARPGNLIDGGTNQANYAKDLIYSVTQTTGYSPLQDYRTAVGTFSNSPSAYGTFDQAGNILEWNDQTFQGYVTALVGGNWNSAEGELSGTTSAGTWDRGREWPGWGFRVAGVPDEDADDDGVNDYRESKDGTDPNNPNSFNPLSKGLMVYYPFDGNANDESGYSNHGSIVGGANHGYDRFGRTLSALAVTKDSGVLSQTNVGVSGPASLTLSIWMKPDTEPGYPYGHLLRLGNGPTAGSFVALTYCPYFLSEPLDGQIQMNFAADQNYAGGWITSEITAFYGRWTHVVASFNNTSQAWSFYVDGKHQTNVGSTNTALHNLVESPLYVNGAFYVPDDLQHPRRGIDGTLDDLRVYNRTLSPSEIKQLYYTEAFTDSQRAFLSSNPTVQGHFSLTEYNANRTNGRADVTTNPSAFNLFTRQQFDSNRTAGQSDVINSPMSYGLYTSDSIMDLRMGGLMIQRQGTDAVVSFQPQTTTDLTLPFTNNGTPVTNTIPMPGNKGFIRINAKP